MSDQYSIFRYRGNRLAKALRDVQTIELESHCEEFFAAGRLAQEVSYSQVGKALAIARRIHPGPDEEPRSWSNEDAQELARLVRLVFEVSR